jgi:hypothetical protein
VELLDEIIDLLSGHGGSLTGALLKTQVLMHRIGRKDLAEWVNCELSGYKDESKIPPYRVVHVRIVGNVQVPGGIHKNTTLPTAHIPDDLRRSVTEWAMPQSIEVLENLAKQTQSLSNAIPPEVYGAFGMAYEIGHVISARRQIEPGQVQNIVIAVRTQLLDLILKLQDEIGIMPESKVKEAAKEIDVAGMLHSAVIGHNATIILGSHNTVTVTNTITAGNFESLASELKKAKVDDPDVQELKTALAEDDPAEVKPDQYGPKVRGWVTKMMGKAVSGAWTVSLSTAGTVLATAINSYYGLN